jgi:hypothetical protein
MLKTARLSLIGALAIVACGGPLKYQLASSAKAPGADAQLVADVKEDQKLTLLQVEITNLAPPSRISEGATHFVAWQRKNDGASWSHIGDLQYEESSRKGKLNGSVPETSFDFEVTAEKGDAPASPSPDVVFSQRIAK